LTRHGVRREKHQALTATIFEASAAETAAKNDSHTASTLQQERVNLSR